jgi:hypothetical protein
VHTRFRGLSAGPVATRAAGSRFRGAKPACRNAGFVTGPNVPVRPSTSHDPARTEAARGPAMGPVLCAGVERSRGRRTRK